MPFQLILTVSRDRPTVLRHLYTVLFLLSSFFFSAAQNYSVRYHPADADSITLQRLSLLNNFPSRTEASFYLAQLPSLLQAKGYITASIDTIQFDSSLVTVSIYLGQAYKWARLFTRQRDQELLQSIRWPSNFSGTFDLSALKQWQRKILDNLEENGYPFGKVFLDSISIDAGAVNALLNIDAGPIYKIDSIRIYGDASVDHEFLQRYLDIADGSYYNKKKLKNISKKLSEISYIQEERPSDLSLLGTGSVLNLYLKSKKSSQANVLFGFQPNSDQSAGGKKFLLTVDANVLLRNALGSGETIGLVWQQLQQKSPKLNLIFEQPYIFHSPFGLNFSLDMYKRDSSFLNININLGTSYRINENKLTNIYLQKSQTILSDINTAAVVQTRRLPVEADVSSFNLGLGYLFNNTDFKFNPRRGNELSVAGTAGTKTIKKNNQVLELKDPFDPSFKFSGLYDTIKLKAYQFRVNVSAAHYLPLAGQSLVKFGLNAGIYQSANYFRNELFRIGGYKLLRGFDEESQFVSQYAIGTAEYRLQLAGSSYFYAFVDGGWGRHVLETKKDHAYLGTGLGLSFETKAGIINLAVAVGKRDDTQLNLRQTKVHLGFASYF